MFSKEEIAKVIELAGKQLNKSYAIGGLDKNGLWLTKGKPSIEDPEPVDFDCSGLSRWIIGQGTQDNGRTIIIPHGCINQIKFCKPMVFVKPRPLDLGFADLSKQDGKPDHVVIVLDSINVIEARGNPYNKVILRPVSAWENQKGFLGFWSVPGVYD